MTNFHSLGTGDDPDDLLAKLEPDDIDFIVVDEAHIAAAESYQRLFKHFSGARTLLMSACFQRMDGKPIDADVVYRYRLIDSIADGNAKNLRVQRFAPDPEQTTYEIVLARRRSAKRSSGARPSSRCIKDERKLARITAKSTRAHPPGHARREGGPRPPGQPPPAQSSLGSCSPRSANATPSRSLSIAEEHGIPCAHLHHSMTESHIKSVRERFEKESGDLQGIVQLRMLGQGYDFPPITVVVPMRPYASFGEFYQFVGRGIRVINHPALTGRVGPGEQFLDVIYHAELGLDEHIETIYLENDMDPIDGP